MNVFGGTVSDSVFFELVINMLGKISDVPSTGMTMVSVVCSLDFIIY